MTMKVIKKLRNKFAAILITSFSIIMVLAFLIIYLVANNQMKLDIQNQLDSWSDIGGALTGDRFFTVEINEIGEVIQINSSFDIEDEQYQKMIRQALNQLESNYQLTVEERSWAFAFKEGSGITHNILENDEGDILLIEIGRNLVNRNHYLLFLDITDSLSELNNLLKTLVKLGFLVFVVIGVISIFFANQMVKPILKSLNRQKQFITDASHELKTPLTIIQSNYGLVVDNQEETVASQMEWLNSIKFGFERLTSLTHNLLVLSQLDDGYFEIKKTTFDFSIVVKQVIQSLEPTAKQKRISLEVALCPKIIMNQDLDKITQVIIILLDNAIKYTNEEGQIKVDLIQSKRQVIFSITNSGPGIAKEHLDKVFDRFFKDDSSRNNESQSFGLGLAIAKAIIEHSGGKISVNSIENEQTTFRFTLKI